MALSRKEVSRRYRERYPDRIKETNRRYRERHPDSFKEAQRRYRERHPDRIKESKRRHYQANREKILAKQREKRAGMRDEINRKAREYYAKNKVLIRDQIRERKYGLSSEDIIALANAQGNRCAACGRSFEELYEHWRFTYVDTDGRTPSTPDVDHDHRTGANRGLLCHGCNLAIGHVDDSPERLRALADYLERHLSQ